MRYLFLRPSGVNRFDRQQFWRLLDEHLHRWAALYVILVLAGAWFHTHYAIGLNASPSLPHQFYLIQKGKAPQRGEYVAFRWAGGGPYPAGVTFVKVLAGMPGDVVVRANRDFYVNGAAVGRAKEVGRQGQPLDAGQAGTLPPGRYYVWAAHPDSLDSRYAITGWITQDQIIGRVHVLF
jgi:conjugal transfer pilin signal peptidase TrbI